MFWEVFLVHLSLLSVAFGHRDDIYLFMCVCRHLFIWGGRWNLPVFYVAMLLSDILMLLGILEKKTASPLTTHTHLHHLSIVCFKCFDVNAGVKTIIIITTITIILKIIIAIIITIKIGSAIIMIIKIKISETLTGHETHFYVYIFDFGGDLS